MSSTTPRTRAWFAVDADWWPAIAEHLPHPWPEDAIRADLRWLRNEGRRVGLALPSRSALVARWGVTSWRARQLLAEHDPQQPEEAPPAIRQPAASRPPAIRQPAASLRAENADGADVGCSISASIPPARRQHSASPPPAGRQATAENDDVVGSLGPLTMNKEPQPQPQPYTDLPAPSTHRRGAVPGIHSEPNPSTPPQEEDDLDWLDAIGASLDADREAASLAALEASAADMGARSTQAPRAAAPPASPPAPPAPPAAPPAPPALTPTASAAPAVTPTDSAQTGPTVAETIARLDAATPQQREQALGMELMAAVARRARAADAGPDWSTLPPLGERRPLPPRPRFGAPPVEHDTAAQLWRAAADHRWRWPQASAAVLRLVDRAGLDALRVRLAWVAERHDALGVAPDWSRVMACA